MEKKPSLLDQLKSKYMLQKIILLAYRDIKSVLKLIKYNKNLINRLDINIKYYYNFKFRMELYKQNGEYFLCLMIAHIIAVFIPYLIYIICFFAIGTFNDKNLLKEYNKKKKSYIDFMNNYILLGYLLIFIISYLLNILFNISKKIPLKGLHKAKNLSIFCLIDLSNFILHYFKFRYTAEILNEDIKDKTSVWFFSFDLALVCILSYFYFLEFGFLFYVWIENKHYDDSKRNILIELNGIKINIFGLSSEFDVLDEKSKNELIFKKENIEKYEYELNENQINIITKINDFRRNNNIPELKFSKNEKILYFMINPELQLVFNQNDNIYKISDNLYIFKYEKIELQNILNNIEIINIIKFDYLDNIYIIEQNNTEFICIYNDKFKNDNRIKINNNNNKLNINIHHINIINTEDRLLN